MSTAAAGAPPQRTRPNTRASIKALNFSSMGKALADVMHKESRENSGEKEKVKKTRDSTVSKRSSLVPPPTSADKSATGKKDKSTSADASTITKHSRRLSSLPKAGSGTSSEEQSLSPHTASPKRGTSRASTLRPRSSLNTSALPKYRPKSALIEPTTRDSSPPPRVGTRRRLSTSSTTKEEKGRALVLDIPNSTDKNGRTISPLPHRNALQVNLTAAINVTPTTPEKDKKTPKATSLRQPSPTRMPSPTRSKQAGAPASPVTRPPSSTSSSSTPGSAPSTPRRTIGRSGGSVRMSGSTAPSPLRRSVAAPPDSPSPRASTRKKPQNASSSSSSRSQSHSSLQTPIILAADSSMDSMDASDVEFMLRDVASPSAPTPALPRFRTIDLSVEPNPHTPPRPSPFTLPGRSNLSYLSPAPPTTDGSPLLRPQRRGITNDRGSILSWEALAQHNLSMGTPDVEHMLRDVDAPFHSLMASPTPSQLTLTDIPESPTLSAMPSPSGYGSISQVLLPDVTPSPAPHSISLRYDDAAKASPVESATANFLRLQLASVENTAQEQLSEIESLRAQLSAATEARLRDTEDLASQISALEEQIHGNLASKTDDRWSQYASSLEEQLARAQSARDEAVAHALKQAALDAAASQTAEMYRQQAALAVATAARDARAAWKSVECTAESELEMVRSSREMLSVLLAGLDCSLQRCL